jgi:hypothetical protein
MTQKKRRALSAIGACTGTVVISQGFRICNGQGETESSRNQSDVGGCNGENRGPMFVGVAEELVLADPAIAASASARVSEMTLSEPSRKRKLWSYLIRPMESYHPDGNHSGR